MTSPNGFQNVVNSKAPPGIAGDFCSVNPRASVLATEGQLVAPAGGLIVGNFAFVNPATGKVSQQYSSGFQIGFLGRNQQGLITLYLAEATQIVPQGFMVTLFDEGEFWAYFGAGATAGQNVYADPNDGAAISAASVPALASGTASAGFTGTGTLVTATPNLTIAAATDGIISIGDLVAGTDIPSNTTIVSQTSGTPGGVGVYVMSANASATVASPEAITTTSPVLNVTVVAAGSFNVGDALSGTGVSGGTEILAQLPIFQALVATTVASENITISDVLAGTLYVGDSVVAAGITAGTTIASQTSGTPGGAGVYVLSANATATSASPVPVTTTDTIGGTGQYELSAAQKFNPTTVSVTGTAVATGFKVRSNCNADEIAQISSWGV